MKTKKKKQKSKSDNKKRVWKCDVQYASQDKAEYIKAWKIYVKREESLLNTLLQKRDLEQQLSLVRIEIIDMCIDTTKNGIANGKRKIKDVTNTANTKITKRKRI